MIEVTRLSRRYGDFIALDDVSFRVESGEIVGLLGHNGAGKSTLMKMLTGGLEPSSGKIRIKNFDLETHRQELQRKLGYLPENCPVYMDMTVIDYLLYQAGLRYGSSDDQELYVKAAMQKASLMHKAFAKIKKLSRGYRQRVGVAQAIMHQPDFLILDEPTNGLDPAQIVEMRELIRAAARTATVIVSTHILQEVEAVCDRVLILQSGKLVMNKSLKELQKSSTLEIEADVDPQRGIDLLKPFGTARFENNQFLVGVDKQDCRQAAARIAALFAAEGIALYQLKIATQTLEMLFRQVQEVSAGEMNA
jgi:ABC-2 type transport system ATP-binding protein